MQVSLKEKLDPVESNDLDNIFAISGVDLLADVQQGEEKFETSISENYHFDGLFIFCEKEKNVNINTMLLSEKRSKQLVP